MNKIKLSPKIVFVISLIAFGALMRLLPHWPNFTPIAAMALFGGAQLGKKHLAFIIPLAALFLSDLVLGLHQWMIAVYVSFALVVVLGIWLKKSIKVGTILMATLASSTLFFIITNFAMWIGAPYYSQDIYGLLECYTLALPFFLNGIMGDLFFSGIFFGSFYLVQQRYPALVRA